jgi:hypothetical protein
MMGEGVVNDHKPIALKKHADSENCAGISEYLGSPASDCKPVSGPVLCILRRNPSELTLLKPYIEKK